MEKSENMKTRVSEEKFADIPINPKGQSGMLKKVSQKTTVIVWIGIAFLAVFALVSIFSNMVSTNQLDVTMYLNQYRFASKTLTESVQSYAVTGDAVYYDAYVKELNEDKNRETAWNGLKLKNLTEEEWAELEQVDSLSKSLETLETTALKQAQAGNLKEAQNAVFGDTYEETIAEINTLISDSMTKIQARQAKNKKIMTTFKVICLLMFSLSFFAIIQQIKGIMGFARKQLLLPVIKVSEMLRTLADGNFTSSSDIPEDESEVGTMVAAINFMNRNYTNMITEISEVLGRMGNGNYRVELKEQYVGDFVAIQESMTKIIEDTRETLAGLKNTATEIGSGSEQLAGAASDLAEGCTTQAAKVNEVSAAINNMSQVMNQEVTDAAEAVGLSTRAGEIMMETNRKMQQLKTAIGRINECSDQIGAIIGVIEDIASQTNLLSLNASIEAARAGDAGRGFAVVAEQVKKLAEQSTEAAGETRKLIENTVQAVEQGILISDEVAADMGEVMTGAKEATDKMGAMAETIRKQSEVMQQINENIAKVAEIVDNNSASSEETAAVGEEQTAQVQMMVQMMNQFEI